MKQAARKMLLMTPGPVPLDPEVQIALAQDMIHHRTPAFDQVLKSVLLKLKVVFGTSQDCYALTCTGSGGMEALLVNTLRPGAQVLCINSGKFGERWAQMAKVFGAQVTELVVPWGQAVNLNRLEQELNSKNFDLLLTQACETSTGVLHPIEQIAKLTRKVQPDCLILVDAITALGATPLPMDEWDLDGVVGGSQKAFMLPTGLSFLSFSNRAWKLIENNPSPRFYFDIRKEREANQSGQTYFSSNVTLLRALEWVLNKILSQGYPHHLEVIKNRAQWTREVSQWMGLATYSQSPSPSVTALLTPCDSQKLRNHLETNYQLVLMGGQDQAKGKIIRIGHMGHISKSDLIQMSERLYLGLSDLGVPLPAQSELSSLQKKLDLLQL